MKPPSGRHSRLSGPPERKPRAWASLWRSSRDNVLNGEAGRVAPTVPEIRTGRPSLTATPVDGQNPIKLKSNRFIPMRTCSFDLGSVQCLLGPKSMATDPFETLWPTTSGRRTL